MASSENFFEFIRDMLSDTDGISYRKMMGEYLIYKNGRVVGGIYDDRLLIKESTAVKEFLENVRYEIPYPNAKPMIFIDFVDDKKMLTEIFSVL